MSVARHPPVEVDPITRELGARIAAARRRAGLTQRELASRLGLSIWRVDQLEHGLADSSSLLTEIQAATGKAQYAAGAASRMPPATAERTTHKSRLLVSERSARNFVLAGIASLVLIRFFTEVIHVLPRALNFIDVAIFVAFLLAAASYSRASAPAIPGPSFALPALLFGVLCAVSATVNPSRVEIGPVLVFVYGFLAPLGIYWAVYRLWPVGQAQALSRFLIALGFVELAVVFFIDLPRFLSSGDPDVVSGTFGTNAYQLVFFLLVFTGLVAGIFTHERGTMVARLAPILFGLVLITVFLAQYRALLATTAVSVVVIGLLLGSRGRGLVAGALIISSFVLALSYVAREFPHLKFASTIATLQHRPGSYVSARLHAAHNVVRVYEDKPLSIAVGTGPGTFSSRAWQTFAQAGSTSQSNVQGRYALALSGGTVYRTDVSDTYVLPEVRHAQAVEGSTQLASPFASYLSVPAEVGLPGLILILLIYGRATVRAAGMTVSFLRRPQRGDSLLGLLIATTIGFTVLLQMGVLGGNWFEVTRITFVSWALFAVASKEFESRPTVVE